MARWDYAVPLSRTDPTPLFLQLAQALADDIRRGRLRPGDRLPGSRRLAATLKLNRNTVLAAYDELAAEGWTVGDPARGTFVSSSLPDPTAGHRPGAGRRDSVPARTAYDLPAAGLPVLEARPAGGVLVFGSGVPDLRLVPVASLARAYRRALVRGTRALLDYGGPRGVPRLRAALATMLAATRGLAATAADVVVTRGSQMALSLVARAVLKPGDTVAVEALGYRAAWDAFRQAGVRLVPLPLDDEGAQVELLADRGDVRAVYVTPHHQYPTMVTLSPGRRLRLLELARLHRFAVIEDDYDHEFHYDGRPVLPLASVDRAGSVIYVGTLSKVLAPGLRLGFVVAPAPVLDRLAAHRAVADTQGDLVLETAVAELLEEGEVQRHVRRARRVYDQRRHALLAALERHLGSRLRVRTPAGGVAVWARATPAVDVDRWAQSALANGVHFQPARNFALDGRPRPFLRLGYACLNEDEIEEAVRRLARTRPC